VSPPFMFGFDGRVGKDAAGLADGEP
jgi:hypothetical protein